MWRTRQPDPVVVSHVNRPVRFHRGTARARGENLRDARIDGGMLCIRPVLITIVATVLALFPLALHGERCGRRSVMRRSAGHRSQPW
jgi:multidrug efflux pump subunit AcrB